jgi:hypothetical protein
MTTVTLVPLASYPAGQRQSVLPLPAGVTAVTIAVNIPRQVGNAAQATATLEDGPTPAGPWRWRSAAAGSALGSASSYFVEGLLPFVRLTSELTGTMQVGVTATY